MQGVEPWTFALLARRSNQLSYTALLIYFQTRARRGNCKFSDFRLRAR